MFKTRPLRPSDDLRLSYGYGRGSSTFKSPSRAHCATFLASKMSPTSQRALHGLLGSGLTTGQLHRLNGLLRSLELDKRGAAALGRLADPPKSRVAQEGLMREVDRIKADRARLKGISYNPTNKTTGA